MINFFILVVLILIAIQLDGVNRTLEKIDKTLKDTHSSMKSR
ncbi:unnamed protein product [marine sediment metagenome]|uniref:Uncharacterized protein n=1 Tax=marine sediment metagenome TaxID=412755 RepID=X1DEU1_9ZZZZ